MRFDLTDLRLFLAVVEAGSITHGAAEIGLSLPAASERLRAMEELGAVKLLERGRRGVTPTAAGEVLAHHARLVGGQMARLRGELGAHAQGLRTTLRLLANTAAITEFLPERLAPWLASRPRVDLDLKERQSAEIARSVAAGFAEIGILSDAVDTPGLALKPFAVDRLVVVAPRAHPLMARSGLSFSEIAPLDMVGLSDGALKDHLEARAAAIGTTLRTRVSLRGFPAICRLAGEGVGVGIVPETAARRFAEKSPGIAFCRLDDPWATRRLSVCAREGAALSPAAADLMDHLAKP